MGCKDINCVCTDSGYIYKRSCCEQGNEQFPYQQETNAMIAGMALLFCIMGILGSNLGA
jgi:hypothetical protein